MATIRNLKVGQTLWDTVRRKMGNTTMTRTDHIPVHIIEVDPQGEFVLARWNLNEARKYRAREVAKWRISRPATMTSSGGAPPTAG